MDESNIPREERLRVLANRMAMLTTYVRTTQRQIAEVAPELPNVSAETLGNLEQVAYYVSWAAQGRFPRAPHLRGLERLSA